VSKEEQKHRDKNREKTAEILAILRGVEGAVLCNMGTIWCDGENPALSPPLSVSPWGVLLATCMSCSNQHNLLQLFFGCWSLSCKDLQRRNGNPHSLDCCLPQKPRLSGRLREPSRACTRSWSMALRWNSMTGAG
jgi:hypothetical protein